MAITARDAGAFGIREDVSDFDDFGAAELPADFVIKGIPVVAPGGAARPR
jgi:hypothetical protein